MEPEQEFTYNVIPRLTQGTATLLDVRDIVEDGVTFLSVRPTSGNECDCCFKLACADDVAVAMH